MEKPGRFALAFTDEDEQVQEAASCRDGICVSSKRVPHKVPSINTKKTASRGRQKENTKVPEEETEVSKWKRKWKVRMEGV